MEVATSNGADDEERPTKKTKGKGKAKTKDSNGLKSKGKKRESSRRDGFTPPVEQLPETAEERADRERVSFRSVLPRAHCV